MDLSVDLYPSLLWQGRHFSYLALSPPHSGRMTTLMMSYTVGVRSLQKQTLKRGQNANITVAGPLASRDMWVQYVQDVPQEWVPAGGATGVVVPTFLQLVRIATPRFCTLIVTKWGSYVDDNNILLFFIKSP